MGNALIASEKSPSLPKKRRKNSGLASSNTTFLPEHKQQTCNEIDSDTDDEYYFDDEDEEETQWSLKQCTATLRDTKIATEAFLAAYADLQKSVSTKVDVLLKDLPDADDLQFETKYKIVQRRLQKLFSKKPNQSKQQTKKSR